MLWLTDQNDALASFLLYGRDLSLEEQEIQYDVDEDGNPLVTQSSPKLIDFQNKVYTKNRYIFNNLYKIYFMLDIIFSLD